MLVSHGGVNADAMRSTSAERRCIGVQLVAIYRTALTGLRGDNGRVGTLERLSRLTWHSRGAAVSLASWHFVMSDLGTTWHQGCSLTFEASGPGGSDSDTVKTLQGGFQPFRVSDSRISESSLVCFCVASVVASVTDITIRPHETTAADSCTTHARRITQCVRCYVLSWDERRLLACLLDYFVQVARVGGNAESRTNISRRRSPVT